MPILNMVGGGKKGGNIGEPLNLAVTTSGLDVTITWEDNEIGTIPPTVFQKSELVRKIGSAPTSPSDGVLVVTETVKDTYKTTGYIDQGLTDGTTYYYRVFSYSDLGGISYCDAVSVTPAGGAQTFDFQNDGALSWTNNNIGWGDCSIVTNEGWQITRSGNDAMQAGVLPPSSVYGGTLTKYKIWAYKSGDAAFGISNSSENTTIEYGRDTNKLVVNGNVIANITLSGELTMEVTLGASDITIDINGNAYTSTGTASAFQTLWSNQDLGLMLGKWHYAAGLYVRKVEITTA